MEHKYLEKTVRVVDTLNKQLAAARKALAWYSNEWQYPSMPEYYAMGGVVGERIISDRGQIARDAIQEIKKLGKII